MGNEVNSTGSSAISAGMDIDDQGNVGTDMADLPQNVVSGSSLGDVESSYSERAHGPIHI